MKTKRQLLLSAATALFLVSTCAVPHPAKAECAQWDLNGRWNIKQSNGPYLYFTIQQNGTALTGSASYTVNRPLKHVLGPAVVGQDPLVYNGQLDGKVQGSSFHVEIYWGNGEVGIYSGTIGATGRIEGNTYIKQDPSRKATWFSDSRMNCASASASATPAPPARPPKKPVKTIGVPKK